jgi:hypothetical protein
MKHALVSLLVAGLTWTHAEAEPYQWTISASSTNPFMNTGAFAPGVHDLYLWYSCSSMGAAVGEFGFQSSSAANIILALIPEGTHTFAPTGVLFVGCQEAPVLVGRLVLLWNAPGGVCFTITPLGTLGTVDCNTPPAMHDMAYIGYSNDGTAPCVSGDCSQAVPVRDGIHDSSWGGVKGLYED